MNKKILWGTVGALILTGGYYASAASSPLKYTDYGYTPVKVSTTTYAPGTPSQYEYPSSPYRVGGKLGPKTGQTWQQKFDAGSTANQSTVSQLAVNRTKDQPSTVNSSAKSTTQPVVLQSHANAVPVSNVVPVASTNSSANSSTPNTIPSSPTPAHAIPLPKGGYFAVTIGTIGGWVPDGWRNNYTGSGNTTSEWFSPSDAQYLVMQLVPWNSSSSPQWMLANTFVGKPGVRPLYWQEVGTNLWGYIQLAANSNYVHYGLIDRLSGSLAGNWEGVVIRVPKTAMSAQWWGLLASWTPTQPSFIPPAQ